MHMYTGQERMVNSVRKYFIWCQYLSCKMMNSKTIFRLVSRYQSIVIQPSAAAVVSFGFKSRSSRFMPLITS